MKYDFWYSEKQKHCCDGTIDIPQYNNFINGVEYTECAERSKGIKSNWDDAIYLGVFEFKDIKIYPRQFCWVT